jgi:hypothetical protein
MEKEEIRTKQYEDEYLNILLACFCCSTQLYTVSRGGPYHYQITNATDMLPRVYNIEGEVQKIIDT